MAETAAELIAKIEVQGADKFAADLKSISEHVDKTAKNTRNAETALQGFASAVEHGTFTGNFLADTLTRGFESLFEGIISMAERAGEAFTNFVEEAIKEATKVETLQLKLTAFSGNAGTAGSIIDYFRQLDQSGVLATFDEILRGGSQIAGAGLDPRHWSQTLLEMQSGGIGLSREQDMMMAARILETVEGGGSPTRRQLAHFALSKEDLARAGFDFNPGADSDKNLDIFQQFVHERRGSAVELQKQSVQGALNTLESSWQHVLSEFGQGWFELIHNMLSAVSPLLEFFAHSGIMKQMGEDFANAMDRAFGIGKGEGLQRIVAYMVVAIGHLPEIFLMAWDYAKGLFTSISGILTFVANNLIDAFFSILDALRKMEPVFKAIGDIVKMFRVAGELVRLNPITNPKDWLLEWAKLGGSAHPGKLFGFGEGEQQLSKLPRPDLAKTWEGFMAQLPRVGGFFSNVSKETDEVMKRFKADKGIGAPPDPNTFPKYIGEQGDKQDEANSHLKEIAHNTADMKEFKKYALGGGERGAAGITPAEFYGRRSGNTIRLDASGASDMMKQAFEALLLDWEQQKARSGIF